MAFLDFLTNRATLRDERDTAVARVAYYRAENGRLRAELASAKARSRRALAILHIVAENLGDHPIPDPDALIADMKKAAPASPGTADPTSPTAPGEPS